MRSAEYAELARERARLAKREKEFASREAKLSEFENLSKRDKIAALKAIGYDDPRAFLEDIARNGGQPSPEQLAQIELKAQFDAIKRERDEERSKASQERQAAEERQATLTLQNDISTFLKGDPKFSKSFIAAAGGDQAIFQVMQNHYQETASKSRNGQGQVLPFAKAAEVVENNIRNAAKAIASTDAGKALMRELLGVEAPTAALPGRVSKPAKTTVAPDDDDIDGDALLEKATRFLKNAR